MVAKTDWKSNPAAAVITKQSTTLGDIDLSNGNFVVHLKSSDTEGLEATSYYHEAQITLADGRVGTPLSGKFKVKANVIEPN